MRFLAFIAAAVLAGQAQAAVVRYDYIGAPQMCSDVEACGEGMIGGMTGWLQFDTASLPGGTLKNTEMSFITHDSHGDSPWFMNYSIKTATGSFTGAWVSEYPDWSSAPFITADTDTFNAALYPTVYDGEISIKTDERGHITWWHITATIGGSWDWYVGMGGDGSSNAWTETPGKWLINGVPQDPAPVPLPASGLLLGAALLALTARSRTSRRSIAPLT